jgi:hypothetical protein
MDSLTILHEGEPFQGQPCIRRRELLYLEMKQASKDAFNVSLTRSVRTLRGKKLVRGYQLYNPWKTERGLRDALKKDGSPLANLRAFSPTELKSDDGYYFVNLLHIHNVTKVAKA